MIDVVGELRIKIPHRIVRQRGKVHDRVETREISYGEIAEIFADFRDARRFIAEVAVGKEVGIQSDDLVAGRAQNRPRNGTDISFMSSK